MSEREQINYDHPFAFDNELMIEHLKTLRQGQVAHAPVYDLRIMPARSRRRWS